MRNLIIIIVFAIALTGIASYLVFGLSPFDEQAVEQLIVQQGLETRAELAQKLSDLALEGKVSFYLNMNSLLLLVATAAGAVGTWVFAAQYTRLVLQRKFYQEINYVPSLRRSIWVALSIIVIVFGRVYNTSIYLLLGSMVLIIGIEYLISKATSGQRLAEKKNPDVVVEPLPVEQELGEAYDN